MAAIEDERIGKLPGARDGQDDEGKIVVKKPTLRQASKIKKQKDALNQASSRDIRRAGSRIRRRSENHEKMVSYFGSDHPRRETSISKDATDDELTFDEIKN